MKLFTKKKNMKKYKTFISLKQRIIAGFMAAFMLLQILLPSAVLAVNLLPDSSITAAMASPSFQLSASNAYLYQQASYDDGSYVGSQNITSFHDRLLAAKTNLGSPTFVPIAGDITVFVPTYSIGKLVGDAYVQNRYIRQQIFDLLGRHLIYASLADTSEIHQINKLYDASFAFAQANPTINYGDNLSSTTLTSSLTADMIWPERRVINGETVLVPVVYLMDSTVSTNKVTKTQTEFWGSIVSLGSITLSHAELTLGANTIVKTKNNLEVSKDSLIQSGGDVNLVVGGTLNLIGSKITGANDVNIIANEVNVKTVLVPFQDKYGSGTKLGSVSSINAGTGSINVRTGGDITFEGSTATASNGAITLNAGNNISIKPVFLTSQSNTSSGNWITSSSSVNVIGSKLTSQDTMSLVAGGAITVSASDLISTQGGLEFLAQQGIYVLDEQGQTQISRQKIRGKTKGSSSEFNSIAIRSVLSAGKGVLLDTANGDITLRASKISSGSGAAVNARNGKVHLLITKEQSQYYENMVTKGTWVIKTHTVERNNETPVPNSIVGGLAVQATQGVDVEYTGVTNSDGTPVDDLDAQLDAFKNIPDLAWMATLKNDPNVAAAWNELKVKSINKNKTTRQLSPAAMAVVAIAIAVATGGASLSAQSFLTATMNAGFTTLETQAASSLLAGNSLGQTLQTMGSDESLKSLAISMVTAGAMQATKLEMFKVAENAPIDAVSLAKQAGQAVVNATVEAGVSVAINGGNTADFKLAFKQSLATDAINTLGTVVAGKISGSSDINTATKYIAYAAMGCLTASLTSKLNDTSVEPACFSGAGGAVVGQAISTYEADNLESDLRGWAKQNSDNSDSITFANFQDRLSYFRSKGVDISRLLAGMAAFAVGGNVNAAAAGAGTVAQVNMNRAVDLGGVYLSVVGGTNCQGLSFNGCQQKHTLEVIDSQLSQANVATDLANKIKSLMIQKGLISSAANINSLYYGNGQNIDALIKQSNDVAGWNDATEFVMTGRDGFVQDMEKFSAGVKQLVDSFTPEEQQAMSVAVQAVMLGPLSAVTNLLQSEAIERIMPDSVANAIGTITTTASTAIGSGITTALEYDDESNRTLLDQYNDVKNLAQTTDEYRNTVGGFSWMVSQITGVGGNKGTNKNPSARYIKNPENGTPPPSGKKYLPKVSPKRKDFDQHIRYVDRDAATGKYKIDRDGSFGGGHSQQEFGKLFDNPRELSDAQLQKIKSDPRYKPGDEKLLILEEKPILNSNNERVGTSYTYATPAIDTAGNLLRDDNGYVQYIGHSNPSPTKPKEFPEKTVYDSTKISDSDYNAAAHRVSDTVYNQYVEAYIADPKLQKIEIIDPVSKLKFRVYFNEDSETGMPIIGNAHLIP